MSEGLFFPQQTTSGITLTIIDTEFILTDQTDTTKRAMFECSAITTATTRTFTFPDASATLVGTGTTQTLTNKSINTSNLTGASLFNPTVDYALFTEGAAPSNPASGQLALYAGTSNTFFSKDSSGNVTELNPNRQIKAWVNFAAVSQGASYTQTGAVVQVFATAHGISSNGMYAALDFTTGSGTDNDGYYGVTSISANSFFVTVPNSHTTTGAVTLTLFVRDSENVSSVTYNALGDYTVNFATPLANIYYCPRIEASYVGGAVYKVTSPFNTAGGTDTPPTTSAFRFSVANLSESAVNSKYICVTVAGR